MRFSRHQIGRLVKGHVTETRRRIDGDKKCRYKRGRSYAVQTPKGKTVTRLAITQEPERGFLHDVDDRAAQRMGYATADDYFEWWREQYGDGPLVEIPVWVIRFELDPIARPRYLAAHAGKLAKADYTSNAAHSLDGVEAVDEAWQDRFSTEGAQDRVARIADYERRIRERPLHEQLEDALDEARRSGVDTAQYEESIAKRIDRIRARTRRQAAA